MGEFSKFFGLSFSALLPLVNPLGSALVFLSMVGTAPPSVYRSLAQKVALSTIIFLFVIELIGIAILNFFGISLPVMQVAGGFALAAMGWSLLNGQEVKTAEHEVSVDGDTLEQKIFYPLTFPITAGPGCIVVMVTLSAHASIRGLLPNLGAHLGILTAVILLSVAVYFCYGYAPVITTKISPQTVRGMRRVIAFVLFCIGVQITWNGVEAMMKTVLKS